MVVLCITKYLFQSYELRLRMYMHLRFIISAGVTYLDVIIYVTNYYIQFTRFLLINISLLLPK